MSENTTEVLVGGAVLAAAVGFFIYAAQVGGYEMGSSDSYRLSASFTVLDDVEVPEDSTVAISSEGLLGGNFVELLPGGSLEALAEGDEVYNTQSSVSLVTLLLRYVGGNGGDSTQ